MNGVNALCLLLMITGVGWISTYAWAREKIALANASAKRLAATAIERGVLLDRIRFVEAIPASSQEDHARLRSLLTLTSDTLLEEVIEAKLYGLEWTFAFDRGVLLNPLLTESDRRRADRFIQESNGREGLVTLREEMVRRRTNLGTP